MSYDGEYSAAEYSDGIYAPRWGYQAARYIEDLCATKDAEIARLKGLKGPYEEMKRVLILAARWGQSDCIHPNRDPQDCVCCSSRRVLRALRDTHNEVIS